MDALDMSLPAAEFCQVKIKAGACGAFVGLIVKMLSRKHL